MKQKANLIRFIQVWGIVLIIGIGSCVVLFDTVCAYRDFHIRSMQMRTKYITRQKKIIKQEVRRAVDMIEGRTGQSRKLTRGKLKSRVYEACSVAGNIYQHNKAYRTGNQIKHMIADALGPVRFGHSGYYFITDFNAKSVLFPDNFVFKEKENFFNARDSQGKYIIRDMIKLVKRSGEGFYEYYLSKSGKNRDDFHEIIFVKLFKPYNWLIGACLLVKDVENQIKMNLLKDISGIRFGREGYIFINRFNGDALVSNGMLLSGHRKLWEAFNKDSRTIKNIFKKELNAALKPHGGYIYYSWIKLTNSEQKSQKASFIYGISDLKWIVGAGVYLDDVEKDISTMQARLNEAVKTKLIYFFFFTVGIVGFFLFLFGVFTRKLKNDFNVFISFFEKASTSDETINRELIEFEELDRMAGYANDMLIDIAKSRRELVHEKEQLFVTIRSIGDGVITTDRAGRVVLMNRVAERLTGWKSQDAGGRFLRDVFNIVNSITRKKAKNPVDRVLSDGTITKLANHTILISKNGREYQIADSAAPIKDSRGEVMGVVFVFRDVTGEYRMHEELQKMQKLKSIGLLAGGIAHDFNNIMMGLFGNISIVKTRLGKDHPEFKFLKRAESSMERATGLTKQLLTFAKGGKPVLEKVVMDVFVEDTVMFDLSGSNVKPVFDIQKDLYMAKIDRGQIQQVLSNITINAVHAMPDGGNLYVKMENIDISEAMISEFMFGDMEQGKYIKIIIRDEGCGIKKTHLDMIFDPYFTTKGAGNGLGLAVVYSIIKKHRGHISVDSEQDKGTAFTFYLPACVPESITGNENNEEMVLPGKRDNAKILIMDDDEAIRMVAGEMLEAIGFSSDTAADGVKAIMLYKDAMEHGKTFDAVIMDLTIPGGMGGKKAIREILKIDANARVIVSSGYADDPVMANYSEYGFKGIIRKPYTLQNLRAVLENVLKK